MQKINGKSIYQGINIKLGGKLCLNFWKPTPQSKQKKNHKQKAFELFKISLFQLARSTSSTRNLFDCDHNNLYFSLSLPYRPRERPYRPYHQFVKGSHISHSRIQWTQTKIVLISKLLLIKSKGSTQQAYELCSATSGCSKCTQGLLLFSSCLSESWSTVVTEQQGQKRLLYSKILHCRYIYDSCFAIFALVLIYNDRSPLPEQ